MSAPLKRLQSEGVIENYRAVLSRARLGLGLTVFVHLKMDGHSSYRTSTLQDAVRALPEVVSCHIVTGEADYLLEVVVPDVAAYERFLLGKLLALPLVPMPAATSPSAR